MAEISIISMVFTALLALICMFLVTAPYFSWDAYFNKKLEGGAPVNSREVLLTTLNELEFEHKMDKLSDTDYFQLKKQYEIQVAKIMKDEQQQTTTQLDKNLMAEVEREIEEATRNHQNKKGDS